MAFSTRLRSGCSQRQSIADAIDRWRSAIRRWIWPGSDDAQAIVILGGGGQRALAPEYGGPSAGPELMDKLAYGAYLSRRTGLPILVTGFGIEAEAMRATLRENFDIQPRWVDRMLTTLSECPQRRRIAWT